MRASAVAQKPVRGKPDPPPKLKPGRVPFAARVVDRDAAGQEGLRRRLLDLVHRPSGRCEKRLTSFPSRPFLSAKRWNIRFAAERVGLVRDGELDEPVEAVAGRVVVAEAAGRDDDAAGDAVERIVRGDRRRHGRRCSQSGRTVPPRERASASESARDAREERYRMALGIDGTRGGGPARAVARSILQRSSRRRLRRVRRRTCPCRSGTRSAR